MQECSRYNVTGDGAVVVNDDCPQRRRRRPDVMQTDVDAVAVSQGRIDISSMRKRLRRKSYG